MTTQNQTQIAKDLKNKKITVTRHFDGTLEQVWRAWTESDLLDQWWAPKPYRAETKTMNFKVGGHWLYAMIGPDNTKIWAKVEYTEIKPHKSFQAIDMFCDEQGNLNPDFPNMRWKNEFIATETGTKVIIEINFASVKDLEKIVEMGFEAGFTMALGNLDELLARQNS